MHARNAEPVPEDYWPKIYDWLETQKEDVRLLRELIQGAGRLRILEPFCGNGRIFIPLAEDGHEIVGMDNSIGMLDSARQKIQGLPEAIQKNISLVQTDVTTEEWPKGFDLVILGANCFYELATPEEQEGCIRSAQQSLKLGGHLYLDNNHMEGDLEANWCRIGETDQRPDKRLPDGAILSKSTETIWVDTGPSVSGALATQRRSAHQTERTCTGRG